MPYKVFTTLLVDDPHTDNAKPIAEIEGAINEFITSRKKAADGYTVQWLQSGHAATMAHRLTRLTAIVNY